MACGYEIFFGYTLQGGFSITIPPYLISPSGTYNGQDYFEFYDENTSIAYILRYSIIDSHWELGVDNGEFTKIAYLDYTNLSCPVNPSNSFNWVIIDEGWILINTSFGEILPEEGILTEEQECFEIQVWDKQCEFSQCVLKYLQMLQFGSDSCKALETLKNKRRVLKILNCYDVRDIPNNTTNYNTITYNTIKKLLSCHN